MQKQLYNIIIIIKGFSDAAIKQSNSNTFDSTYKMLKSFAYEHFAETMSLIGVIKANLINVLERLLFYAVDHCKN